MVATLDALVAKGHSLLRDGKSPGQIYEDLVEGDRVGGFGSQAFTIVMSGVPGATSSGLETGSATAVADRLPVTSRRRSDPIYAAEHGRPQPAGAAGEFDAPPAWVP